MLAYIHKCIQIQGKGGWEKEVVSPEGEKGEERDSKTWNKNEWLRKNGGWGVESQKAWCNQPFEPVVQVSEST